MQGHALRRSRRGPGGTHPHHPSTFSRACHLDRDHLQLRPQIQNYDLQSTNPRGQQYSLDMSLFEGLVQPPHETDLRVPYSVLDTQRRMHPSIAELVRSILYPSLKDAETVNNHPEVVGMRRRLFWFHHSQLENVGENSDSLSTSRPTALRSR